MVALLRDLRLPNGLGVVLPPAASLAVKACANNWRANYPDRSAVDYTRDTGDTMHRSAGSILAWLNVMIATRPYTLH